MCAAGSRSRSSTSEAAPCCLGCGGRTPSRRSWYEGRRPKLGTRLLSDVDRVLNLIQHQSGIGSLVPRVRAQHGVRRVPLRRFPYFVIYRERDTEIQIVAFAHTSRKPGYWRHRKS